MADKTNLTKSLKDLETIVEWFEQQEDVDIEQGLLKVKEAASLIKDSKARLAEIENEFIEIEKDIITEPEEDQSTASQSSVNSDEDAPINLDEIPF